MGKLVTPEVYLVGYTMLDNNGIWEYLRASGNEEFWDSVMAARDQGLSDGEILCSFYAKLCYAALTLGHNDNITRIRDIPGNLKGCHDSGHASILEHASINFVARNVSRVFTHELVRHRVGTAFSQTSGRYVRGDEINIVFDPILEPVKAEVLALQLHIEEVYREMVSLMKLDTMTDFSLKKKITSALRRLLPNGQTNEIGFTLNLRTIRHTVQLRTSRHAEWEIRYVFDRIYTLLKDRFPLLFYGAREEDIDGALEVTGMKIQPYELTNTSSA